MAFPTGWTKYDTIILPAIAALSAPLADVPYVITNLPATVYAGARSDGGDLRCTISDGSVEIPLEVVSFNTGAETCELHLLAPLVSPGSTNTVRIYYGAASETMPAANSTYGSQAVWAAGSNADYTAVYHLNEAVNNDAGGYKDSTANANHGTGTSMSLTPVTNIGLAQDFDGSADYITVKNSKIISDASNACVTAWVKTTATPSTAGDAIYSERASAGNDIWKLDYDHTYKFFFTHRDDAGTLSQPKQSILINDGVWHAVGITKVGTSVSEYVDGINRLDSTLNGTDTLTNAVYSLIGGDRASLVSCWTGQIDEVRISASARSADWLYAEYYMGANQSAPTYGGEQSIGGGVVAKIFQQMAA